MVSIANQESSSAGSLVLPCAFFHGLCADAVRELLGGRQEVSPIPPRACCSLDGEGASTALAPNIAGGLGCSSEAREEGGESVGPWKLRGP